MHNIDWDDFRYVLAVADRGSLSAAARALGVNHATVLRRIASFESTLGVELFEKRPGGYRVRPDSAPILRRLHGIEQSVASAQRSILGLSGNAGYVGITSTDSMCQLILPRHVGELNAQNPGLQVTLSSTNSRLNLAGLDAEITIRPAKSLSEDLDGVHACQLAFGIYGAPDYLEAHPSADLAEHAWLGVSELLTRSPVGDWEKASLSVEPVFRADSFLTLAAAAAAGIGLAMVPVFVGEMTANLVRAPQFDVALENRIWVAAHPDLFELERIQYLVSFFVDALRADADLLEGRV